MRLLDRLESFVKDAVRTMFVARPEDGDDPVRKHPSTVVPPGAQVTVRADEWAVASRDGRPMGTLDAGRHTMPFRGFPTCARCQARVVSGEPCKVCGTPAP